MRVSERAMVNSPEAIEKRREKERKREERDLKKAAKAAGVKLSTLTPVVGTVGTIQNIVVTKTTPGTEPAPPLLEKKSGFSGWSTVESPSSGGDIKTLGRATVSSLPKHPSPPPEPSSITQLPRPHPSPLPEPSYITQLPRPPKAFTSGFRSGGWATLEGPPSASTPNRPLTPKVHDPTPPHYPIPPPPEPAPIPNPPEPSTSGFNHIPIVKKPAQVQLPPTSQPIKKISTGKRAEASRSGWQSFSRGGSKR